MPHVKFSEESVIATGGGMAVDLTPKRTLNSKSGYIRGFGYESPNRTKSGNYVIS